MGKKKVKILGIAPYEGMKSIMTRIASQRDDVDLTVYVGDLNEGVEIAKRNISSNFDIIISRGGTAEMISQITDIPLIEISISVYDILRAIKLAENYSERYAIVGYPVIINGSELLCDLLQCDIDLFTIHSKEEAQETLIRLKNQGYKMVLSDMITTTIANRIGLNSILITSGDESIISAIDQAVKLFKSYVHIKDDNQLLEDIIRGNSDNIIVFDNEKNIIFNSIEFNVIEEIIEILSNEVSETLKVNSHKIYKTIDDLQFKILGKKILNHNNEYAVYYLKYDRIPTSIHTNGITYYNHSEVEDSFFNNFFSIINSSNNNHYDIEQLSLHKTPVLITGEPGTGKSQMANLIYTIHPYSNNPLITIDCSLLSDKAIKNLLTHENSPLLDDNNVIFIKNLQKLDDKNSMDLLTLILDIDLHKKNKLIISNIQSESSSELNIAMEFLNQLQCSSIHLDPLRNKVEEIPNISSLYLGTLNLNIANQILGIEPDAMKLLQDYSWPYNYTQFKRILNELSIISSTSYITKENVKSILEKESNILFSNGDGNNGSEQIIHLNFDPSMTLDEINRKVIELYLKLNDNNYTSTAKQLGISRTTLWRHLK